MFMANAYNVSLYALAVKNSCEKLLNVCSQEDGIENGGEEESRGEKVSKAPERLEV